MIGWFNKEFVKTQKIDVMFGRILHKAYDKRAKGDYDDYVEFEYEEAKEYLEDMIFFINGVKDKLLCIK